MATATETQQPVSGDAQITTADTQVDTGSQHAGVNDQKDDTESKKADADVEVASIEEEGKAYYSKKSVWLMILFSGLAIGSDG